MTVSVPSLEEAKTEYEDPWEMCHDMMEDMAEQFNEEIEEVKQDQTGQEARLEAVSTRLGNLIDVTLEDSDKLGYDDVEEDNIETRLSTVEQSIEEGHIEDATPGVKEGETGSQTLYTPLDRICAMPEHVAEAELTANQQRARFIAKDIDQYGQSVPAGYRINTTDMRKVLQAAADENETIYRTTVKRVMDFLGEFGGDDVKERMKHGKKSVVLTGDLVERLKSNAVCYGGEEETPLRTTV